MMKNSLHEEAAAKLSREAERRFEKREVPATGAPEFSYYLDYSGLDRYNLKLDKVVAVIVPDEEIVKRISGRRTCRSCDAMYHVVFEPPAKPGVCDKCGGELYQREDDAEDTVRERLKVFAETTRPLLDHYGRLGLLAQIDGVGRTDEVEKRIISAVNGVGAQSAQS